MNDIQRKVEVTCPLCHGPMREVSGKNGAFLSCQEYPACRGTVDIGPDGAPAPVCPGDPTHGHMRFFREGRHGPWFGCKCYPDCKETMEAESGDTD